MQNNRLKQNPQNNNINHIYNQMTLETFMKSTLLKFETITNFLYYRNLIYKSLITSTKKRLTNLLTKQFNLKADRLKLKKNMRNAIDLKILNIKSKIENILKIFYDLKTKYNQNKNADIPKFTSTTRVDEFINQPAPPVQPVQPAQPVQQIRHNVRKYPLKPTSQNELPEGSPLTFPYDPETDASKPILRMNVANYERWDVYPKEITTEKGLFKHISKKVMDRAIRGVRNIILYIQLGNTSVRAITLSANLFVYNTNNKASYKAAFEEFKEALEEIFKGEVVGSDRWDDRDDPAILTNAYTCVLHSEVIVQAESRDIVFKCQGLDKDEKHSCFEKVFLQVCPIYKEKMDALEDRNKTPFCEKCKAPYAYATTKKLVYLTCGCKRTKSEIELELCNKRIATLSEFRQTDDIVKQIEEYVERLNECNKARNDPNFKEARNRSKYIEFVSNDKIFVDIIKSHGNLQKIIMILRQFKNIDIVANGFELQKTIMSIFSDNKDDIINAVDLSKSNRAVDKKKEPVNGVYPFKTAYIKLIKLKIEHISMNYLCGGEDENDFPDLSKTTVVYDEFGRHVDILTRDENNEFELKDDLYISSCGDVYVVKDNIASLLITTRNINKNTHANYKGTCKYIFFDYETVFDMDTLVSKPYSLSAFIISDYKLKQLEEIDKKNDKDQLKQFLQNVEGTELVNYIGFDCGEKFCDFIIEQQQKVENHNSPFVFVSFNGANFDNFLLLNDIYNYEKKHGTGYSDLLRVTNIRYNKSRLLSFDINNIHTLFDIRCHLVGSLAYNCTSFEVNLVTKESFDHGDIQTKYMNGELMDYLHTPEIKEKLIDYNNRDVLSLAVIFKRYISAHDEKIRNRIVFEYKTIGSLVMGMFNEHLQKKIHLQRRKDGTVSEGAFNHPKLDYDDYDDVMKTKSAGRVQCFQKIFKIEIKSDGTEVKVQIRDPITGVVISLDVCSLYPYILLSNWYACGDLISKVKYNDVMLEGQAGYGKIGFFRCDIIDQYKILSAKGLPNIVCEKTDIENIWDSQKNLMNYMISTVQIDLLESNGVTVIKRDGFYFTDKIHGSKLFPFLLDLMNKKNQQDTYKKTNNPLYNPAMRETFKLISNSISGKLLQRIFTENTVEVNSLFEADRLLQKKKAVESSIVNISGDHIFLHYKQDIKDLIKDQAQVYQGVLCYNYSQKYMFEHLYSKCAVVEYTDTDSGKMSKNNSKQVLEYLKNTEVPHSEEMEKADPRYKGHKLYNPNGKVYGSYEDEYSGFFKCIKKCEKECVCHDHCKQYIMDKKFYVITNAKYDDYCKGDPNVEFSDCTKNSLKGVSTNMCVITGDEPFLIKKKDKYLLDINTEDIEHNNKNLKLAHEFFCDKKNKLSYRDNITKRFCEPLMKDDTVLLLANSFKRVVNQPKHNVKPGDSEKFVANHNTIQIIYSIKRIKLSTKWSEPDAPIEQVQPVAPIDPIIHMTPEELALKHTEDVEKFTLNIKQAIKMCCFKCSAALPDKYSDNNKMVILCVKCVITDGGDKECACCSKKLPTDSFKSESNKILKKCQDCMSYSRACRNCKVNKHLCNFRNEKGGTVSTCIKCRLNTQIAKYSKTITQK